MLTARLTLLDINLTSHLAIYSVEIGVVCALRVCVCVCVCVHPARSGISCMTICSVENCSYFTSISFIGL
jgi:hypothetical protein